MLADMYASFIIRICFIILLASCNCLAQSSINTTFADASYAEAAFSIDSTFNLPSPLPTWPPGDGFATGTINLGGLLVCQITSFKKVWATYEGGESNLGATFFEPTQIPDGFFMLGFYSQSNRKPLFGWALAGKDVTGNPSNGALRNPIDYTLVWSSQASSIKQDGIGYIWLPTPPDGYKVVGYVVTNSPEKPALDKIHCIRADFTDNCEADTWIWGSNGFDVHSLRPSSRGVNAQVISAGTFVAKNGGMSSDFPVSCLKNIEFNFSSSMPNLGQIESLIQAYSPLVYFHPDEAYLPSSVTWFFINGALLYKQGEESNPVTIEPTGSNLPQGGADDDAFWLDLPLEEGAKEKVKRGDLQNSEAYLHIKPMHGATFTDIAIWVFYPFNGRVRAKIKFMNLHLGRIGEHVGDWEHVTLRISNFDGALRQVYFSEHSGGKWVEASELEFENGNKVLAYSSLHGHAFSEKAGLILQGSEGVGIRNDFAKSNNVMDIGLKFSLIGAEYAVPGIGEPPPWVNYLRKWGPTVNYDIAKEIGNVKKLLIGKLKSAFGKLISGLPDDLLREQGPTGPKIKRSWSGDEV